MSATPAAATKSQLVATELRRRIEAHVYAGVLPPATAIADEFGVASKTVQRALEELDAAGLTAGRQGRPRLIINSDTNAGATLYERIAADLIHDTQTGVLGSGDRVPSEVDLVAKYNTSRATIRKALDLLEAKAIVVKRAGRRYISGTTDESDLAYERVAQQLRANIVDGAYESGRLPGENDLATQMAVSRPTVRQALISLQGEGLIYSAPKRGWFIVKLRQIEEGP